MDENRSPASSRVTQGNIEDTIRIIEMRRIRNPLKSIREKCLDCCCNSTLEVSLCPARACSLYPFRFGKNPFRAKRKMTDEQKKAAAERLAKAREMKEALT